MDDEAQLTTEAPTSAAPAPRRSNRAFALVLAMMVLGVAAGSLALHLRPSADDGPPPVLSQIQAFSLVERSGKTVTLSDLAGDVWVADFIYTSCQTACPMLTSRMGTVQDFVRTRDTKAGGDAHIRLVSFSVDPQTDTPDRLAAYATKWNADPRIWLWLTGSIAEMNRAVTEGLKIPFGKGAGTTDAFDVMHGEKLVLVDRRGRIRGYYDADPDGIARLERAIDRVATEPSS
jgi:protein SCO1/2